MKIARKSHSLTLMSLSFCCPNKWNECLLWFNFCNASYKLFLLFRYYLAPKIDEDEPMTNED